MYRGSVATSTDSAWAARGEDLNVFTVLARLGGIFLPYLLFLSQILMKGRISLREQLSEDQAVEFCMLVGHYVMVAGTINTLGVRLEPGYLKDIA